MNLNENFAVSHEKFKKLKDRIFRLKIDLRQIEESFQKGGGKGGQKVNKSANAVQLSFKPMNLVVKVHRERQRNLNRFLALRELVDQIEMKISPHTSGRLKDQDKRRKQKNRRRRRHTKKSIPPPSEGSD